MQAFQNGFVARGLDPWTAHSKALAMIDGMIQQQSAVLAFDRAFFLIGALFFVCLPLLLLLKSAPRSKHHTPEPVEM
jgi:DHA2 family multidrug resistance protein